MEARAAEAEAGRVAHRGIVASFGIGVGRAVVIYADHRYVRRHRIEAEIVPFEQKRLMEAIDRSRRELEDIRRRLGKDSPADYRLILDAHLMMHRDELLADAASTAILREQVNAEWAVERAVAVIATHLQQAPMDYFRDRASDVEHVGRRIVAQLAGRSSALPLGLAGAVLVVDDLHPADAIHLIEERVAGLVTGLGSATSHTAILARALGIPAVVGISDITARLGSGDEVIIDALRGEVVVGAADVERAEARERGERYRRFSQGLRTQGARRTATRDGVALSVMANIDMPAEAGMLAEVGARGIGLYRSEYLFLTRTELPTEDEQYEVYAELVRRTQPLSVTLRTFDLGGDALKGAAQTAYVPNPALGLRATRLALQRPEMFGAQLRAALRAAALGPMRIMFPLIAGIDELRRARAALDAARAELEARGVAAGDVRVGVMIELPSAVMMADRFVVECDFLSVGTNDLVQYGMGVDRSNPAVAYLAQAADPAVLRMLALVQRSSELAREPTSMCGDMAADPLLLPLVIGLGFRHLSVPVSAIPLVREVISRVDSAQAEAVALRALACATAAEVRALVEAEFGPVLEDVWAETGASAR